MGLFRRSSKAAPNDIGAPPPYQPASNSTVNPIEKSATYSMQGVQVPEETPQDQVTLIEPIDPNDEVELGLVNTDQKFRFSQAKLEQRDCKGFLKIIKDTKDKAEDGRFDLTLGSNTKSNLQKTWSSPHAPAALSLFAEWVDTGKLKPKIKHVSSSIGPYYTLYIIAWPMASEVLCNSVIDEVIAYYSECKLHPGVDSWQWVQGMTSGEVPEKLKDLLLQYFVGHPKALAGQLSVKSNWDFLGALQYPYTLLLLDKSLPGSTARIHYPAKKIRCVFHIHQATQPCKN